jgi:UDP-2,3-diacylglucosamine pyrophosphatase LpxH
MAAGLRGEATRAIVISDLHLGGAESAMMSWPDRLAAFVTGLPADLADDEQLELVIAGDVIDFLAVEPFAAWTPDPQAASQKLASVVRGPHGVVFEALSDHVGAGHRLTVLLGNHDIELALPAVQAAFLEGLAAAQHEVRFVDDGRAWRIGGALIEHGNRYDEANVNDWDVLRASASAQSRGEDYAGPDLETSAGSEIVFKVINPLKERYPFIDLLQPQGEVIAFLLLAFEPSLKWDWGKLARMIHGKVRQDRNRRGRQPGRTRNVAASDALAEDPGLRAEFGEHYESFRTPRGEVGTVDWIRAFLRPGSAGLREIIDSGGPSAIPLDQLLRIRAALRSMLKGDHSQDAGSDAVGPCGAAALRLLGQTVHHQPVQVVVMGHTHQPREVIPEGGSQATYINTGTWVDVIRVPDQVLADGDDALVGLRDWLVRLCRDAGVREVRPTWADLRIEPDGTVSKARLRRLPHEPAGRPPKTGPV